MDNGIGDDIVAAYNWINQPLFNLDLPISFPHPVKAVENALGRAIDGTAHEVLQATGLLSLLEKVTGQPQSLAQAADAWLAQAHQLKDATDQLRQGAKLLSQTWRGAASAAFGRYTGQLVGGLDSMVSDMGTTAAILSQAAHECQTAEDMINEIIREAIEFTLATLATTTIADLITLGLASIIGGIIEAADMTALIGRATAISVKLGEALEKLLETLKELKTVDKLAVVLKDINSQKSTFRAFWKLRSRSGSIGLIKAALGDQKFTDIATNRVIHLGVKTVESIVVAPVMDVLGLEPDPVAHVKEILTSPDGESTIATNIDEATETGQPAPPYNLPAGQLNADLEGLTILKPIEHKPLNLD